MGDEDCWELFGDTEASRDSDGASAPELGGAAATSAAGVPASDHPYFKTLPVLATGHGDCDENLSAALEEYVPTACELLASTGGVPGRALGASLRRVAAKFIARVDAGDAGEVSEITVARESDGVFNVGRASSSGSVAGMVDCERVARRCASEAWQMLQRGARDESVIHAHAFAHALVASTALSVAASGGQDVSAAVAAEAMRHADLAILVCPELPVPALHCLTARCDALCVACRSPSGPEETSTEWVIPSDLSLAPKAPQILWPILRRRFVELPVTRFREELFLCARPAVIEGLLDAAGWAALQTWKDLRFWMRRHGHRSVPVELGVREDDAASGALSSSPEAEGSLLISEFVEKYLLPSNSACYSSALEKQESGKDPSLEPLDEWSATPVAYLAQHLLLLQIPGLRADISVPHYCALGSLRTVNVWLGTAGTVTALHYDEDDNFLAQVAGFKYVRLYIYDDSPRLYATTTPRTNASHGASFSPVRAEHPDLGAHPEFAKAGYTETILAPGDVLFIPKRTWHYVRSLTTSVSVNFWF